MQRSLTIGVSGAIPPALLDALLPGKGVLRRPNAGDLTALSTPAQTRLRLTACGRSASMSFAPCGARRFGGFCRNTFQRSNKAGHGAVSFGIPGANRMAVIAPLLHQLLAHTGVAIHDLSGGRDGRR
jgi:hypothetical protein